MKYQLYPVMSPVIIHILGPHILHSAQTAMMTSFSHALSLQSFQHRYLQFIIFSSSSPSICPNSSILLLPQCCVCYASQCPQILNCNGLWNMKEKGRARESLDPIIHQSIQLYRHPEDSNTVVCVAELQADPWIFDMGVVSF